MPPPNVYKQTTVQEYGRRFGLNTLIETGTYYGAMLLATRSQFDRIYSIELDARLHRRACRLFAGDAHVELANGDSTERLGAILDRVQEPALFWLDAHYSGQGTARGTVDTPVAAELNLILSHTVRDHVILIDDASDFGRLPDYPAIDNVRQVILARRSDYEFEVRDNIIRSHPRRPNG